MTGSRNPFPSKFHTLGHYSEEAVTCDLALGLEAEATPGLGPVVQNAGMCVYSPSQVARGTHEV